MSAASDKFENDVAATINKVPGIKAERPKVSTSFPDVKVEYKNYSGTNAVWVEVKMNHTDNLMNPRFSFIDGEWVTPDSYKSPATDMLCKIWNNNNAANEWLMNLQAFLIVNKWTGDVNKMSLYSTKTDRGRDKNSVPVPLMKKYLQSLPTKNICKEENINVGELVATHYLKGKAAKAYYLNSGDDFYQFKLTGVKTNPFKIPDVPVFKGTNSIVLRVGDRSDNFEIQAEVKLKRLDESNYSAAPSSKKQNPFRFVNI
jgi:hypothetical protein